MEVPCEKEERRAEQILTVCQDKRKINKRGNAFYASLLVPSFTCSFSPFSLSILVLFPGNFCHHLANLALGLTQRLELSASTLKGELDIVCDPLVSQSVQLNTSQPRRWLSHQRSSWHCLPAVLLQPWSKPAATEGIILPEPLEKLGLKGEKYLLCYQIQIFFFSDSHTENPEQKYIEHQLTESWIPVPFPFF